MKYILIEVKENKKFTCEGCACIQKCREAEYDCPLTALANIASNDIVKAEACTIKSIKYLNEEKL